MGTLRACNMCFICDLSCGVLMSFMFFVILRFNIEEVPACILCIVLMLSCFVIFGGVSGVFCG